MDKEQILTADLNDLVFENKNKEYGAYWLRKNYPKHLRIALIVAVILFVISFLMPYIVTFFTPAEKPVPIKKITYTELSEPPPIDKNTPPPPPPDLPPPPPKTIKFTPPVVKPDEEVKQEDVPPPIEEVQKSEPSSVTTVVDPDASYSAPPPTVVESPKAPQIFTFVQQMPEFPGGEKEMINYLYKNIRYPTAARENGIEGTVMLEFVVNEDGSISGIKALRQVAGGCTEEAIRVVGSMPKWKAGMQNGNAVKVYFHLPVTFKLGR